MVALTPGSSGRVEAGSGSSYQASARQDAGEDLLQLALDASGTGIYRYDFGKRALDYAHGLDSVFGFEAGAPLKSLEDLLTRVHQDDLGLVLRAYQRSAEHGDDFDEEFRIVRPDRSIRWISDRGRVTRDATGRPRYLTGACIDVTARRTAEIDLRASELNFRLLANAIPQLAWIADADGKRSWLNNRWREYTGLPTDDMLGLGWQQLLHPDDRERIVRSQLECFAAGRTWESTGRLRRADGQYRWFLSRAVPIPTSDDRPPRWFGTNTDIHEQTESQAQREELLAREREVRAEAQHAAKLRDEVLSIVAHDLRNPVHTIMMCAGAMADLPLSEEESAVQLRLIRKSAHTMDRLIHDLLDVTRIETGRLAITAAPLALGPVIQEAIDGAASSAAAAKLTLSADLPAEIPEVMADRDRVVQVLGNLIGNAIKYTPAGGRIVVTAAPAGSFVSVTVTDTGRGIAAADLPRLFERYWQADRAQPGVGLGLAIVRGIIEAHGGRCEVRSMLGAGSAFSFTLPCH